MARQAKVQGWQRCTEDSARRTAPARVTGIKQPCTCAAPLTQAQRRDVERLCGQRAQRAERESPRPSGSAQVRMASTVSFSCCATVPSAAATASEAGGGCEASTQLGLM